MESAESDPAASGYVIPRYRAEGDVTWFHALLGTVPGHQIDFIYAPEVPQAALDRGHLGHLWRLMKYIEPRAGARYAFALGNLSRDDVGYEPGHGGVAILYALRVAGVTDHAGRAMPPYAHSVLAIDRQLNYATLLEAISVFYRRFLEGSTQGGNDTDGAFYRRYFQMVQDKPEEVVPFLDDYVANFDELPQVSRSALGLEWEADPDLVPARVTIVHPDDEPFGNIAHTAAMLGSILYRSNIRWTTITSGREIEIPGGVSIRFVPVSEAPRVDRPSPRNLRRTAQQDLRVAAARDPKGLQINLDDLPSDEAAIAHLLFGAKPPGGDDKLRGRRAMRAGAEGAATGNHPASPARGASSSTRPPALRSTPPPAGDDSSQDSMDVSFDESATLPAPLEADPRVTPVPVLPFVPAAASGPVEAKGHAPGDVKGHPPVEAKGHAAAPAPSNVAVAPTANVAVPAGASLPVPATGNVAVPAGASLPVPATASVAVPAGAPKTSDPSLRALGAAAVASVPVTPVPRVDSPLPPAMESGPTAALDSEMGSGGKSKLGMWIGILGGIGVIVAILVAVMGGSAESGVPGGSGESATTDPASSGTQNAPSAATPTTSAPATNTTSATSGVAPKPDASGDPPSRDKTPPEVSTTAKPTGTTGASTKGTTTKPPRPKTTDIWGDKLQP